MLKPDKLGAPGLTVDELVSENEALRARLRELEESEDNQRQIIDDLRKHVTDYLSTLEEMPDTYLRADPEGYVEFVSRSAFELMGYTPDEMVGHHMAEFYTEPGGRDRFFSTLMENGGRVSDFRGKLRRRDGKLIWVSISSQLRRNETGAIIGSQGTIRDITERREAEEALRLSEERYALAATAINDGIWDLNIVTGEFYQSARWYEILGLRKEEERPKRNIFYQRLHPDDLVRVEYALTRHFDFGEPYNIEIRLRHNDGHYIWVRIKGSSVSDADGKPVRMLGSLSDITGRMEVTQALRESEAQMRLVTDALPVLISYIDRSHRYRFANRAYAEWLGIDQEALIGRHLRDVIGLEIYEADAGRRARVFAGESIVGEGRAVDLFRKNRYFRATRIPRFDGDGGVVGYYYIMVDLTEHVDQEEQLRQSQKMDALGQLTGGVAHEFNNLLLVIVGSLETLLARTVDDPIRESAMAALDSAMRGSELTGQLLAFSRKQTLNVKPLDGNGLVLGMSDMLQAILGETIEINTNFGADVWPILADAGQLESALLNLSLNARDAMPKGGTITVTTANRRSRKLANSGKGDFVMIDVSDTGTGMTPDVIERAMDPFFTTKDVGSGTGLGLSMVYGFAEQSGGSVEIKSTPGEGTHVTMFLPRAPDDPEELPVSTLGKSDPQLPPPEFDPENMGGNILVVEDDLMVRKAVTHMLQDFGCHTIEAGDANEAKALLAEHPEIDLLFTDVVLPGGVSGIDLANEARRRFPELKILLSSGYPRKGVEEELPDGDDLWFLEKPYRAVDLSLMLAEIYSA